MITRLTDKIWIVEGGKNGRYPYAHSLYVADGGGILVDAGSDPVEIERLRTENGIAAVVMTHYHEDHFTFLPRLPDTPVWSSAADAPALESLETLLAWYGVLGNEWDAFYRKLFAGKFPFAPRKVARRIADGEELRFAAPRAVALGAPGHTPAPPRPRNDSWATFCWRCYSCWPRAALCSSCHRPPSPCRRPRIRSARPSR